MTWQTMTALNLRNRFHGIALFLFVILCPADLWAHPFGGVFQKTVLYPMGSFVTAEYETHIGRDVLLALQPDTDRDGALSPAETEKFMDRLARTLIPGLSADLDGTPLALVEMERTLTQADPGDLLEGVNAFFALKISLQLQDGSGRAFRFFDHNFLAGELDRINYYHGVLGPSGSVKLLDQGRGIEIVLGQATQTGPAPAGLTEPGTPPLNNRKNDLLTRYFTENQSGLRLFLIAMAGAFALGAVHALSPGHGKAMVAAYLVGARGRVSHAVMLGLIVTASHVAAVVLLGVAALILSEYLMPQTLIPWIGRISGGMIFAIGYWMLAQRALHHTGHAHHHAHDHTHHTHHDHTYDGITRASLVSMGVAGGIVPCPSALVVLLLSLSFSRLVEGLVLIFFFSLGLAAVLVLVGILTVKASRFAEKFSETRTWIQRLPVFSAGIVMVIGMVIIVQSFIEPAVLP